MTRGFLLPEGCKDLIDVLQQSKQATKPSPVHFLDASKFKHLVDFMKQKQGLLKFEPTQPLRKPSA